MYKLICNKYHNLFIEAVNLHLRDGWRCQGGVQIFKEEWSSVYYQAMVKDE